MKSDIIWVFLIGLFLFYSIQGNGCTYLPLPDKGVSSIEKTQFSDLIKVNYNTQVFGYFNLTANSFVNSANNKEIQFHQFTGLSFINVPNNVSVSETVDGIFWGVYNTNMEIVANITLYNVTYVSGDHWGFFL